MVLSVTSDCPNVSTRSRKVPMMLFLRKQHAAQVAEADAQRAGQAELNQGSLGQLNRIFEELTQVVDARLTLAQKHDLVGVLRIGSAFGPSDFATLLLVGNICEPAALASRGKCCSHQFMTRSLLEKNRWPPRSMRFPL